MDLHIIQQGLQHYYAQQGPVPQPDWDAVAIRQVENITTGWESDLFTFVVEQGPAGARQQAAHVLRLHNGHEAAAKAKHEFVSIQQLAQAGYSVPQVYAVETDATLLGKPFLLMERIEGRPLGDQLRAATPDQMDEGFARFAQLFVQLHRLDWHPFVSADKHDLARDPYHFVDQWVSRARQRCQTVKAIDFMPLVTWVAEQRDQMACAQPAATHRDFHPDNILIRPDGTPVVIDWTSFAVTDARFDLAWTLLLVDMHIGTPLRQQILQHYETVQGQTVDALDVFLVTACFRRLIDLASSLLAGPEHAGMRPEAVLAMKANQPAFGRAYDLLVTLTGLSLPALAELIATFGSPQK